jgi:hypothetical protein
MADPIAVIRKELDDDLKAELDGRTVKPEILLLIKLCRLIRKLSKESK